MATENSRIMKRPSHIRYTNLISVPFQVHKSEKVEICVPFRVRKNEESITYEYACVPYRVHTYKPPYEGSVLLIVPVCLVGLSVIDPWIQIEVSVLFFIFLLCADRRKPMLNKYNNEVYSC